jgi:hypothetical protein
LPGIRYYGRRRRQIVALCKNRHTQESGRRIDLDNTGERVKRHRSR